MIGESKYFDPAYFGMQSQRAVQTAGSRAKREALGKFGNQRAGLRRAEERRFDLGISTGGQTAYLQGADAAQQNRLRTQSAGLSVLPTSGNASTLVVCTMRQTAVVVRLLVTSVTYSGHSRVEKKHLVLV
jgi:hypothetical protein